MLQLNWVKSTEGQWLDLARVNLAGVATQGVYIIWHGGAVPRVVRVGQGDIRARVGAHRNDQVITRYSVHGLFVTWATVPAAQMDGVERYLANMWNPLVGDVFPNALPIAVTSPWA
jgi:hypothetical protein